MGSEVTYNLHRAPKIQQPSGCCHAERKVDSGHVNLSRKDKFFQVAEKVIAIALGAFAAVIMPTWFAVSFALGMLVGLATHDAQLQKQATVRSCSQGFIEQMTGVRLPDSLALLSGVAVTAVHIEHHPEVFVPIIGVTVGLWAGRLIASAAGACYRKWSAVQPSKPSESYC